MIRWFRALSKRKRAAQRERDVAKLWPLLWALTEGNPANFLYLASKHSADSWAWRRSDEWEKTNQNPGTWAAKQVKEKRGKVLLILVDRHGYFVEALKQDAVPTKGDELTSPDGYVYEVDQIQKEPDDDYTIVEVTPNGRISEEQT